MGPFAATNDCIFLMRQTFTFVALDPASSEHVAKSSFVLVPAALSAAPVNLSASRPWAVHASLATALQSAAVLAVSARQLMSLSLQSFAAPSAIAFFASPASVATPFFLSPSATCLVHSLALVFQSHVRARSEAPLYLASLITLVASASVNVSVPAAPLASLMMSSLCFLTHLAGVSWHASMAAPVVAAMRLFLTFLKLPLPPAAKYCFSASPKPAPLSSAAAPLLSAPAAMRVGSFASDGAASPYFARVNPTRFLHSAAVTPSSLHAALVSPISDNLVFSDSLSKSPSGRPISVNAFFAFILQAALSASSHAPIRFRTADLPASTFAI